jgi:uncharacterized RDD family membrane protein YckC
MYCSKCGAAIADGAVFCTNCGQSFSIVAAPPRAAIAGGMPAVPGRTDFPAVPRVEYAGFWLRFLARLIDNVILGLGFVLVLIPIIFLTGLGSLLSRIRPDEGLEDAGIFLVIGVIFLAATVSLLLTWLYHALMESSEWQATVGKKVLGLVVTDMAGQRASFGRSSGRHFGKMITNLIPAFIGYIMAGFTDKRQALHDMMAGCLVLRRNS